MRTIKKKLKVKELACTCYNTVAKEEVELTVTQSEIEKEIPLPENHVLIKAETVDEKEVTYVQTPQEFVKHARIEE